MTTTGTAQEIIAWCSGYLAGIDNDREKKFDLEEHREKRSLNSNSYYWALLTKLARKLHMSSARLHNLLLRECAPPFIIGGKVAMQPVPDTEEAEEQALESETFHIKPTSGVIKGNDGAIYRWYMVLRGSSTFCVSEMGALLDRLIEDCKEQGIETLSQDEIERMRQYELHQEQKKAQKNNRDVDHAESTANS